MEQDTMIVFNDDEQLVYGDDPAVVENSRTKAQETKQDNYLCAI
jgi:hypothetical protein